MEMTEQEILKSYREAKKPEQQIKILAELNNCEDEDIIKIVEPIKPKAKVVKSIEKITFDIPNAVYIALMEEITRLNGALSELRIKKDDLEQRIMEYEKARDDIDRFIKINISKENCDGANVNI